MEVIRLNVRFLSLIASLMRCIRRMAPCALLLLGSFHALPVLAQSANAAAAGGRPLAATRDYVLAAGDQIKISVFQNADLTLEVRVSENGTITFPLIGVVQIGGLATGAAEMKIAKMLKDGGFLVDPQVTILVSKISGTDVAALGQFNKPGRYPLETTNMRLSDLIAEAGGISPNGSDTVIFTGVRDGKPVWKAIDISTMFVRNQLENDFVLQAGDALFVDRYPLFYIYGEVQRPGSYRIERGMTVMQALASGGGLTQRGTQRGIKLRRKDDKGEIVEMRPELTDPVKPEDVIYVRESIF